MKRLWLFYFPLLFLPNLGFAKETAFGVLEVSDWLILPFMILVVAVPSAKYRQLVSELKPMLWAFLVWTLLVTLSIHFRYQYLDDIPILAGSCLKLARLALYATAGIMVSHKLSDSAVRREWAWSMLAALLMLSFGLVVGAIRADADAADSLAGYKSYNAIVVSVAILSAYIAGLWIDNVFGRKWNRCACLVLMLAVCSVLLSTSHVTRHGRGGWVSLAVGLAYIFFRRTGNPKILMIAVVVCIASITAYETLLPFQSFVDMTFSPDTQSNSLAVDDGARLSTWSEEAPKFFHAPFFGTGFYHRGGESGLWASGSHNFFIQMFLETGAVGGILILVIFAFAWRLAGYQTAARNNVQVATRAALITAVVGGMSGEYYYGGIGVLVLFAALAVVGSLPTAKLEATAGEVYADATEWQAAS